MSTAILRPKGDLGVVEAMGLRDNFKHVLAAGGDGVIVDLTGIQTLSVAGVAAVTNLLGQGRQIGIPVRVLPPETGSEAALFIEQADLRRFLAPGGLWDTAAPTRTGLVKPINCSSVKHTRSLRRRLTSLWRGVTGVGERTPAGAGCGCPRPSWMDSARMAS